MAVDGETSSNPTMEKEDIVLKEKDTASPTEWNAGVGAEASITWKTWVVIFVSSQSI